MKPPSIERLWAKHLKTVPESALEFGHGFGHELRRAFMAGACAALDSLGELRPGFLERFTAMCQEARALTETEAEAVKTEPAADEED